jgi:hypothetical protein
MQPAGYNWPSTSSNYPSVLNANGTMTFASNTDPTAALCMLGKIFSFSTALAEWGICLKKEAPTGCLKVPWFVRTENFKIFF